MTRNPKQTDFCPWCGSPWSANGCTDDSCHKSSSDLDALADEMREASKRLEAEYMAGQLPLEQ